MIRDARASWLKEFLDTVQARRVLMERAAAVGSERAPKTAVGNSARGPRFRRSGASIGIALVLALGLPGCEGRSPVPRSVLLVVVDTLRADHLGVYGYRRPTSPALDRRAERAAVFERAWATSPWTLPSFGSLYTGQIPSRHAAGLLRQGGEERSFAFLDESAPSIGQILAERGFATAAVVNNRFLHPAFGLGRGFETWDYVFVNYAEYPRASQIVHWGLRWLDARRAAASRAATPAGSRCR